VETSEFWLGVAMCLLSNQKTPFFLMLKWQYECLDLLGVGVTFSGVVGVLAVADIPASASQSAWASVRLSVGWIEGGGASVRRFYAEVEIRSLLSLDPFPTAGSSRIFHICSWILPVWHSRRKEKTNSILAYCSLVFVWRHTVSSAYDGFPWGVLKILVEFCRSVEKYIVQFYSHACWLHISYREGKTYIEINSWLDNIIWTSERESNREQRKLH